MTSISQRGAADSSNQRCTDSTTHRPLMMERHVFIPACDRRPNTENDRQDCSLKLKTANGYKPYQLLSAELDNRPDLHEAQLSQRDRATLCVS